MTPRTQNLLSVAALIAAFVIALLPESASVSPSHAAAAPVHVTSLR